MLKTVGVFMGLSLAIIFACKTIKIEDSLATAQSFGRMTPVALPSGVVECKRAHDHDVKETFMIEFDRDKRLMMVVRTLSDGRQLEYVGAYASIAEFGSSSGQSVSMFVEGWRFNLSNFSNSNYPEFQARFTGDATGEHQFYNFVCQLS